jgi:hypothetical protein
MACVPALPATAALSLHCRTPLHDKKIPSSRNPDFPTLISPSYLSDADHCPAVGPHGRRLLRDEGDDVKPTYFLQAAGGRATACNARTTPPRRP